MRKSLRRAWDGLTQHFGALFEAFRKGDAWTRLSFVVMGMGCLARGQIVKGLLYLAA